MSGKSKVLQNTFLYTFSTLLVKAIGFILLPVYTLFLTPEDYGITNLINSFIQVTTFIIAFSLYSAVIRFYTDYKDDRIKLKRFYGTIIVFIFISGSIFISLGFILNELLISWFFEGIEFYPFVMIALITLIFVCFHTVHQNIMQGMQHGKKLTIINLSVFGLQVCLNLLFIAVFKLGAVGVLLAVLIINVAYFIYMLFDLNKNNIVTFCLDIKILREALKYSVPLMPHNLATQIASFASRIFLNNNGSLASVGLYSVATQFSVIIDTIQASVNRAFTPWFYDMMNRNNDNDNGEVLSLSRFLLILYSLLYVIIGLFSQEAIILMTNTRYIMAWTAIPILIIAFSLKSIYYFYVSVLFYYKEAANKIFIATIIGSFADIMIAYLLVPLYGMYGSAVSFLIAKIILVTIVIIISRRYNNVGYRVMGMIKIIVPSLLFMIVGLYFSYTKFITVFSWINLLYKFGILLAYLGFIYMTNRKMINRIIKSGKIQSVLKGKKSLIGIPEN
jgi:O-antigen/teichoic acid export membrane protein